MIRARYLRTPEEKEAECVRLLNRGRRPRTRPGGVYRTARRAGQFWPALEELAAGLEGAADRSRGLPVLSDQAADEVAYVESIARALRTTAEALYRRAITEAEASGDVGQAERARGELERYRQRSYKLD